MVNKEETDNLALIKSFKEIGYIETALGLAQRVITLLTQERDTLEGRLESLNAKNAQLKDAAEMLWVVLANVSEGDWTKQTIEWQQAAARWRDNYFDAVKETA